MAKRKQKIRLEFRKNRAPRKRETSWTREFKADTLDVYDSPREERVSGKGELVRKRTVTAEAAGGEHGHDVLLHVDESACLPGCVLEVHGLTSTVQAPDGRLFQCATRRLLRTLATEQRHVLAAGDRVRFRPVTAGEGVIERVEPRRSVISRESRGRQHVLVANVDQFLIIASAAEPPLKPNLIDRFLVTAEQARVAPLICINKIDLVDPAELQPLVGLYSQMGYAVLLTSAKTGAGIGRLQRAMQGRQSAVVGQSGVGKSSLLNAVEPTLGLRVGEVSRDTQKGRHTTTVARLVPLACGGYVIDTPGIRQFQPWDVAAQEVAGYFRDLRPFINRCRFPDCTHRHEEGCAVKDAVADELLDVRRYESYCHLYDGEEAAG